VYGKRIFFEHRRNIVPKRFCKELVLGVLAALFVIGCTAAEPAPAPQPAPPPMPIAQPAPIPVPAPVVAPPATPLTPVAEEVAADDDPVKPRGSGVAGVDKPLPGKDTTGEELLGNYTCKVDVKGMSLGPFKLPGVGCRIFKADDGAVKLGPVSKSVGSLRGNISDSTSAGFFVTGAYTFPGNKLAIKSRMKRKGTSNEYSGKGRGMLNGDKSNKIQYTMSMVKK
jgi:hypothetical protein